VTPYRHPRPAVDQVSQGIALAGALILVISAPLLMLLVALGAPGGFVLIGVITLLLALPLVMQTVLAPAVTVEDDALVINPRFWSARRIRWEAIRAIKPFPLLPAEDAEVTRRIAVGRRHYQPAAGVMLVIPSLPPVYRIAGFFAGENAQPIIALTSRAHADYESLLQAVLDRTDPAIHDLPEDE
jgi:hypothetical protein